MALVIAMEAEIIILVDFDTLKVYYKSSIFLPLGGVFHGKAHFITNSGCH